MLKKTSATIGLATAATAGALLAGSPAQAQGTILYGWHSHHARHHNVNLNRIRPRIFIRIFIFNKNNNVAVVRPTSTTDLAKVPHADGPEDALAQGPRTVHGAAIALPSRTEQDTTGQQIPAVPQGGTSVRHPAAAEGLTGNQSLDSDLARMLASTPTDSQNTTGSANPAQVTQPRGSGQQDFDIQLPRHRSHHGRYARAR